MYLLGDPFLNTLDLTLFTAFLCSFIGIILINNINPSNPIEELNLITNSNPPISKIISPAKYF